ncbi:WG repeat-containing protein [Candidatus Dependentiae bacterium]|nr:WG repeat-containing protein [Candidatus Dependentiae bacterium]
MKNRVNPFRLLPAIVKRFFEPNKTNEMFVHWGTIDNPGFYIDLDFGISTIPNIKFSKINLNYGENNWIITSQRTSGTFLNKVHTSNYRAIDCSPQNIQKVFRIIYDKLKSYNLDNEQTLFQESCLLDFIENWYFMHCNGDWEHSCGFDIFLTLEYTWEIEINLEETEMEDIPFEAIEENVGEDDWIYCEVKNWNFVGKCSIENLEKVIILFKDWVENHSEIKYRDLFPYNKGDKWGFCDREKNIIIECKYDGIYPFEKDYAPVKLNNKWGVINRSGTIIIPPKYDAIGEYRFKRFRLFSEDLISVKLNNKLGVIYIGNNIIRYFEYNKIYDNYSENLVKELDKNPDFEKDNKKTIYKSWKLSIGKFAEYHAPIVLKRKFFSYNFPDKYGYIDSWGKEIIPCKYDYVGDFSGGIAVAKIKNKYGFIDYTNKTVISFKYDDAKQFSGGFSDGLARVSLRNKKGKKWGFVNRWGKEVIPIKYDDAFDFSDFLACVRIKSKYGFINKQDEIICPIEYDDAKSFSEELACVKLNEKWGFINREAEEVISCKYDDVKIFSEGYALVKLNGKWGYIDKEGKELTPTKYKRAMDFKFGVAPVLINNKWGLINTEGKEFIPAKYDEILEVLDFKLILIKFKDKLGYIDTWGTEYWED